MARVNLDDWVPEEVGGTVLTKVAQESAVERVARRETMRSETKLVPRYVGDTVHVIQKGAVYPEGTGTADEVLLTARKFGGIVRLAEEDVQDIPFDVLEAARQGFARSYARKLDNAALGVTVAEDGTDTAPFTSVYRAVATNAVGNRIQTAGALTVDDLSAALGTAEASDYFDANDLVVIAHPSILGQLRLLKDQANNPVVVGLDGTPNSIFGYDFALSAGARTSAAATDAPTGNPLIIMGPRQHLILGVRSGPEAMVSREANFESDEPKLKWRARRGFAVANPEAFSVIEITAA